MNLEKLPCVLLDDEVMRKGEELAAARKEHHELSDAAKASAAEWKAKLKAVDEKIDDLAEQVRSRREDRKVEVVDRNDMTQFRVLSVRTDTGEVIRMRAMTVAERQPNLFPIEGASKKSAKSKSDADPA